MKFTQEQIKLLSRAEKQGRYIAQKLAQVQQEQRRKLEYERNKKPVICDTIQTEYEEFLKARAKFKRRFGI
jgi:hypothetical protein